MGVAALVLITLTASVLLQSNAPDRDALTEPLATLEVINLQSDRDRQAMLKTMQWDLRALKLEVDSSHLEPDQARQMNAEIDRLMARVQQVGMFE